MQTWTVGNVTVTRIEEQVGPNDMPAGAFLPDLVRERLERHAPRLVPVHYDRERDRLITSIHSWLIRTDRHVILLDCCAGNHKARPWLPRFHMLDTPFLERLAAAGASPADIDIVLCTHLHADHVGWNTKRENGRWVPTFPKARYLFSRVENDYWNPAGRAARHRDDKGRSAVYLDSVLPVIESGQSVLLDGDHDIDERLLVRPAPGHTPGHVVLHLNDRGERALFCGDVLHHPVQVLEPAWNSAFCELPDQARATRRRALEYCAEHDARLFPTHFAAPHVATISSAPDGFDFQFVAPSNSDR